MVPPEPCQVTFEPCTNAPLDFVLSLSDNVRPIDLPSADDEGIGEAYPLPGDIFTPEGSTGESSLVHSDLGSHFKSALPSSIPGPDHAEGQPVTVHEFLQDMTRSKARTRKYGRRKRLGTVKLDAYAYDHNERWRSPTSPLTSTSNCHIETQARNDRDQRVSAYPQGRVQSERPSRQVSHLRRNKRFAKSLAQRLFEADVFSSGTSSRSTGVTPDQNTAHISSRRPLQFITSLNLTPSMESRIYGKNQQQQPRFEKARTTSSGSADSEIQPVSQADDSVPDSLPARDDCPSDSVATSSGGKLSSNRIWNGAGTRKRTRARASAAVMRGSGKRAFLRTRHGGGKRSSAQVPHNPFQYVPLPLVRVKIASRNRRTGATSSPVRKPQSCILQAGTTEHGHKHMCGYQNQFQTGVSRQP